MRASGTNRGIDRVKRPRRRQSRGLLHPARLAVHEDPEPELEVDEGPDRLGRQDILTQPVGIEYATVETAWRSENVAYGVGHSAWEPSVRGNRERPLVPALDDAGRKQGPHDFLQKTFRLVPTHLECRRDAGYQLDDAIVQERHPGFERDPHAPPVLQHQET